jgi:hypothetical protein
MYELIELYKLYGRPVRRSRESVLPYRGEPVYAGQVGEHNGSEVGGSRTYAKENCGCPSTAQDKGGPAAAAILSNGVLALSY